MADDVHIHDWTRVSAGDWHNFHLSWIAEFKRVLNHRVLPDGYYAQVEKPDGGYTPDVLTFEAGPNAGELEADPADDANLGGAAGGTATLAEPQSRLRLTAAAADWFAGRRRPLGIRSESGDRLVALLELTSPSNKDRPSSVQKFVGKVEDAIVSGVHVALIDLFPPRRADGPGGLIGAASEACGFEDYDPPSEKPLCVASIVAADPRRLYAEPLAVGDALPDLPIFLTPGRWVPVPLASTYAAAWEATPKRWRKVIAGDESG